MSWLYSRALVEEYLGDTCLDGEPSVQSSGNPTQLAYCAPDKMTVFSRLSRFGMTYKPLTESRGGELLTLYLAAFPARTLAQQDEGQGLKASAAECGITWRGWLAKYDPNSCSWKTAQCSLLGEEPESLAILPKWGMTVDGLLWEQPTLERPTSGTGSGLSPDGVNTFHTPGATNGLNGGSNSRRALAKKANWATPSATDGQRGGTITKNMTGISLTQMVNTPDRWPTPRSCSAMAATITPESAWADNRFPNLETIVGRRTWPTPIASDSRGSSGKPTPGKQVQLVDAVKFATPLARDYKSGKFSEDGKAHRENQTRGKPLSEQIGGKLNPTWVEWLMGWPLGWTDLKPLATDKSLCVPQQHGES